ncbi:hypothetical protein CEN49_27060, partial [Fischerella thermalis CCMEE 5273]
MKVWLLQSDLDKEFEELHLVNFDDDYDKYFNNINEPIPIANIWEDVKVYTLNEGLKSDFPHFWGHSFVPVF